MDNPYGEIIIGTAVKLDKEEDAPQYKGLYAEKIVVDFAHADDVAMADQLDAENAVHFATDGRVIANGVKTPVISVAENGIGTLNIEKATADNTGGEDAVVGSEDKKLKSLSLRTAASGEQIAIDSDGNPVLADEQTERTIRFKEVHVKDRLALEAPDDWSHDAIYDIANVNAGTADVGSRAILRTSRLNDTEITGGGLTQYVGILMKT